MEPYSIADRVKIIQEYYKNGEKIANAHRALRNHFGTANCPNPTTIGRLVRKFVETGAVDDRPKVGKTKSIRTEPNIAAVRDSIQMDPTLSVACRAQKLGIPRTTLRRIMQNDLNLQAVTSIKTTNIEDLKKNDGDQAD